MDINNKIKEVTELNPYAITELIKDKKMLADFLISCTKKELNTILDNVDDRYADVDVEEVYKDYE